MKLFLDSSVLLAASGSALGASRLIVEEAGLHGWLLISSVYCFEETRANLAKLGKHAERDFEKVVAPNIECGSTSLVIDLPMVYKVAKDRPVIATALALKCEVLLTLDRADFQRLLGNQFYGLRILTPGDWLKEQLRSNHS
jgi:uncharacterized protein